VRRLNCAIPQALFLLPMVSPVKLTSQHLRSLLIEPQARSASAPHEQQVKEACAIGRQSYLQNAA